MSDHKCTDCGEPCELEKETFDYSATHCAPNGGVHWTGFYLSDCCGAEYEDSLEQEE